MKLRDIYGRAKEKLAAAHIDTAALDARLLIAHILDISQEDLLLKQDNDLSDEQIQKIEEGVAQRAACKPVAKIIGQKEFYGRMFLTNEHTLDPRPDTETLIDAVRTYGPQEGRVDILDLGTGTGCLLLTFLAEFVKSPRAIGTAVDQSMRALAVAQLNAERLNVADRVVFKKSDWFENVTGGPFDIIVSNPPYIPSAQIATLSDDVKNHDPMSALDGGADGLDPYRTIVIRAAEFMKPGGLMSFEVGAGQAADVAELLEKQGFQAIQTVKDLAGIDRVVLAKRP